MYKFLLPKPEGAKFSYISLRSVRSLCIMIGLKITLINITLFSKLYFVWSREEGAHYL